jgi:hypothetical protein
VAVPRDVKERFTRALDVVFLRNPGVEILEALSCQEAITLARYADARWVWQGVIARALP